MVMVVVVMNVVIFSSVHYGLVITRNETAARSRS